MKTAIYTSYCRRCSWVIHPGAEIMLTPLSVGNRYVHAACAYVKRYGNWFECVGCHIFLTKRPGEMPCPVCTRKWRKEPEVKVKRTVLVNVASVEEIARVLTGYGCIQGIDHEGTITYELEGEDDFALGRLASEIQNELNCFSTATITAAPKRGPAPVSRHKAACRCTHCVDGS